MRVRNFHQTLAHNRIVEAIRKAERQTSGEIRVCVSRRAVGDPMAAAQQQFDRLGMAKTQERNAVLLFIAPRSQTFAIIGDSGVHEKCGQAFWDEVAATMTDHFKKEEFTAGLIAAIERAGALLAEHFPRRGDDRNELPDHVIPHD